VASSDTTVASSDTTVATSDTTVASSDTTVEKGTIKKSEIEGPISYEAREIETFIEESRMVLIGNAKVTYQDMVLSAAKITVDWENSLMRAEGVPDTVWVKEEGMKDSVQVIGLKGTPDFSEAGDVMRGEVMIYNFKTRKGRVLRGRTTYEDGYYSGKTLKLLKSKTIYVANASFTTCDREEDTHFHFWSKKMRIDADEKVVAKPLVMFIGRIPVMVLPFAYFPIRKGRHSGILIPKYGDSSLEGQYLKGLGYYWAASDYWDIRGPMDYYEKSGFLFRGDLNYAVRYKLSGRVSGSWTRKDFEVLGTQERRWDISVRHSQEISPSMKLLINGQFVSSGNFYRDLSANRERRLQQEIRSNATLTKRWGGSKSMTINFNRTMKLDTDEITETLPRISFRGGQFAIFPKPEGKRGEHVETRWYNSIYASYSSQLLFKRNKTRESSAEDAPLIQESNAGWDHSIRLSSPQKLLGWLTINPSVDYRETWFDKRKHYFLDAQTNSIQSEDEKGFFSRRSFNTSASFSTKLYGLFRPRFIKNVIFRHVATPSFSFRYRPDFSKSQFGYYQTLEDTLGQVSEKDRYYGSIFGSTLSGEQKSLNISFQNLFQMKVGEGEDVRKFDLLTWNLSTSYNWAANEYQWRDMASSLRSTPVRGVSLNFRTTHSFYRVDEDGNRVNRLLMDDINWGSFKNIFGNPWFRTTNIIASVDLRLKGRAGTGGESDAEEEAGPEEEVMDVENLGNMQGDRLDMDERVTGFEIPWDLTATINFTENRYNPLKTKKTWWVNANLNFNLTKNWKISYRARFDLMEKDVVSQDLIFYRDLHCWEARIVWTPTGNYKRFYFRINIKSPMLKDIKVEKGTGRTGLYGY
jgi:lipopolysaccharide assembly outer membrane protein LptD (OstA)